jgi:RNA polymerase sigma-70 factor (ECF subfamily)
VPFAAYLFRIARNALIDFYRRSNRSSQPLALEEHTPVDFHPDPGEVAIANMEKQEIRELLAELRDDYRTVLLLRFLGDLSPEETAEVMGKSPGAVRVLQHRALSALRKLLGP